MLTHPSAVAKVKENGGMHHASCITMPSHDSINMIAEPQVLGKLRKLENMIAQIQLQDVYILWGN